MQNTNLVAFGHSSSGVTYGAYTENSWDLHEVTFYYDGSRSVVWLNGHYHLRGGVSAYAPENLNGIIIGTKQTLATANWFNGNVAAHIVYSRALNPEEHMAVREYLYDRYQWHSLNPVS